MLSQTNPVHVVCLNGAFKISPLRQQDKDFKMSAAYTFQSQINFLFFLFFLRLSFVSSHSICFLYFRLSFFRPKAPNNWSTTPTLSPPEGALLIRNSSAPDTKQHACLLLLPTRVQQPVQLPHITTFSCYTISCARFIISSGDMLLAPDRHTHNVPDYTIRSTDNYASLQAIYPVCKWRWFRQLEEGCCVPLRQFHFPSFAHRCEYHEQLV